MVGFYHEVLVGADVSQCFVVDTNRTFNLDTFDYFDIYLHVLERPDFVAYQ